MQKKKKRRKKKLWKIWKFLLDPCVVCLCMHSGTWKKTTTHWKLIVQLHMGGGGRLDDTWKDVSSHLGRLHVDEIPRKAKFPNYTCLLDPYRTAVQQCKGSAACASPRNQSVVQTILQGLESQSINEEGKRSTVERFWFNDYMKSLRT